MGNYAVLVTGEGSIMYEQCVDKALLSASVKFNLLLCAIPPAVIGALFLMVVFLVVLGSNGALSTRERQDGAEELDKKRWG